MVWTREFRGPLQPKSGQWIQDKRQSGGMLVDKSCHHFDLMNWWAGARPVRVTAFGASAVMRVVDPAQQVNDHSSVSFEYDNGVIGTLHVCLFGRDFPGEELEMGVIGEEGSLQTRVSRIEILQWKRGTNQKAPLVHAVHSPQGEGWGNHLGFDEMHTAFIDAVLEGKPVLTSVRDCLDGTLLSIAAEKSIAGKSIETLV
jgi:predicted dehydrogenase